MLCLHHAYVMLHPLSTAPIRCKKCKCKTIIDTSIKQNYLLVITLFINNYKVITYYLVIIVNHLDS